MLLSRTLPRPLTGEQGAKQRLLMSEVPEGLGQSVKFACGACLMGQPAKTAYACKASKPTENQVVLGTGGTQAFCTTINTA